MRSGPCEFSFPPRGYTHNRRPATRSTRSQLLKNLRQPFLERGDAICGTLRLTGGREFAHTAVFAGNTVGDALTCGLHPRRYRIHHGERTPFTIGIDE